MKEEIISFLKRKQGYSSGDILSQRLGISRQALWKHIEDLREYGYDIVAVPHLGYKLISSPDRLFAHELKAHLDTKLIGRKIHYFETLSSTMDMALELALAGEQQGAVIVAESQNKGRGRQGRSWSSPKYKGLYLSVIMRPNILPNAAAMITLVFAVGIAEAINQALAIDAKIKWPNDILIANKKAGGILTELNAETDRTRFVIIGIGLNINNEAGSLGPKATSLKEQSGAHINRIAICCDILKKIEENYNLFLGQGSAQIINKWRQFSLTLNKRVKAVYQNRQLEGVAVDIDSDGGLLIRSDSGIIDKITAGDITHCRL